MKKGMETSVQSRMHVNNVNELQPLCHKSIDENITFENCHLVAEYLIGKDMKLAVGLLEELKMQIMLGDRNERRIG